MKLSLLFLFIGFQLSSPAFSAPLNCHPEQAKAAIVAWFKQQEYLSPKVPLSSVALNIDQSPYVAESRLYDTLYNVRFSATLQEPNMAPIAIFIEMESKDGHCRYLTSRRASF